MSSCVGVLAVLSPAVVLAVVSPAVGEPTVRSQVAPVGELVGGPVSPVRVGEPAVDSPASQPVARASLPQLSSSMRDASPHVEGVVVASTARRRSFWNRIALGCVLLVLWLPP